MTYTKRCYLNAKSTLSKARWLQFFVFCVFGVLVMYACMLWYMFLFEMPFTIFYIVFCCIGHMLIGGIVYLVFNEYQQLNQYIKSLKQECKEYEIKLKELEENDLG